MTTATPQARLDDIGRTTGSMQKRAIGNSLVSALQTLYILTLRQYMRGKRWLVIGVLFLLPVGLAILLRTVAPDVPLRVLEFVLVFFFIPQALLPLVALIYASGIIRDDQEEQTITYLLVRPIPKWAIYAAKLAATMTTTVLLTVPFTVLTYAAVYLGAPAEPESVAHRCLLAAAIHSLAVVAYCSLFGLMSLLTKRILIAGVIYTAVVEGVLANFPFGIRLMTVIYYARIIAYRSLAFIVPAPSGQLEDIAAEGWQLNPLNDPALLEHPALSTCVAVLVVSSLVCAILAAWLCSRREFHVKTPENE